MLFKHSTKQIFTFHPCITQIKLTKLNYRCTHVYKSIKSNLENKIKQNENVNTLNQSIQFKTSKLHISHCAPSLGTPARNTCHLKRLSLKDPNVISHQHKTMIHHHWPWLYQNTLLRCSSFACMPLSSQRTLTVSLSLKSINP